MRGAIIKYHNVGPGFGVSSTGSSSGGSNDVLDHGLRDRLVAEEPQGAASLHLLEKLFGSFDHLSLEKCSNMKFIDQFGVRTGNRPRAT